MRSHPLPNALHRHLFARNEIALDESTAGRGKGIAVMRVVVDAQRCAVFEDDGPRLPKSKTMRWNAKRSGSVRCYIAFLPRLSGAKIAELRATETPSQSVRYSIHLLPGTPSSRVA